MHTFVYRTNCSKMQLHYSFHTFSAWVGVAAALEQQMKKPRDLSYRAHATNFKVEGPSSIHQT